MCEIPFLESPSLLSRAGDVYDTFDLLFRVFVVGICNKVMVLYMK